MTNLSHVTQYAIGLSVVVPGYAGIAAAAASPPRAAGRELVSANDGGCSRTSRLVVPAGQWNDWNAICAMTAAVFPSRVSAAHSGNTSASRVIIRRKNRTEA